MLTWRTHFCVPRRDSSRRLVLTCITELKCRDESRHGTHECVRYGLPDQTKVELDVARLALRAVVIAEQCWGCDIPRVYADHRKRRVIENVEGLRLQLDMHTFADRELLPQRPIEIVQSVDAKYVPAQRSEMTDQRLGQSGVRHLV